MKDMDALIRKKRISQRAFSVIVRDAEWRH
jgi:hypothetical protein